jgi:hypothetical protein
MQAFQYDINGYYSKVVDCQIDPRASVAAGKTVYLLPGSATFAEPLPEKPGFKVKFTGTAWEYEEIPAEPEDPEPTPEELKQAEIWELKGKLAASDYAVIKIAEGAATAEEYADLIKSRQEWRARINELGG